MLECRKHSVNAHYLPVIFILLFLVAGILLLLVLEYVTIYRSIHDVIQLQTIILPIFIP